MKFERFLDWIQKQLLNYPDINFNTIKMFISEFVNCLSEKELERYKLKIQMINTFTNKQISLDALILKNNLKNYTKELDDIKKWKK